jgi:aspartate kinase
MIKVYKFGGASVCSAEAVKNVARILKAADEQHLVVVQSAMGKMTNLLEAVWEAWCHAQPTSERVAEFVSYHMGIAEALGLNRDETNELRACIRAFTSILEESPGGNHALAYDRVVAYGELVGTRLVHAYLLKEGLPVEWLDARHMIVTDSAHRNALVDWERTKRGADVISAHLVDGERKMVLTQGFIARSSIGNTTTLGREGSDYTAAIFAFVLRAESVTIWKDVQGMLNADPKWFNNTVRIESLSFREAIELSYYGASVIHPKTIKPLQNKGIPLHVKSFVDPSLPGTVINSELRLQPQVPLYIFKPNQLLISISPRDFSFIIESNLRDLFEAFAEIGITVNLMQNSAISFSVCVDHDERKLNSFLQLMQGSYQVRYNTNVALWTIRHYNDKTAETLIGDKELLLEQRSRQTLRMVVRDPNDDE